MIFKNVSQLVLPRAAVSSLNIKQAGSSGTSGTSGSQKQKFFKDSNPSNLSSTLIDNSQLFHQQDSVLLFRGQTGYLENISCQVPWHYNQNPLSSLQKQVLFSNAQNFFDDPKEHSVTLVLFPPCLFYKAHLQQFQILITKLQASTYLGSLKYSSNFPSS